MEKIERRENPFYRLSFNSYSQSLEYLYQRNEFAVKMGLHNIRSFLEATGYVNNAPVFHVAGTNGKGSICHYLAHWLSAMGVERVGLYTSPHLVDFRERIRIDDRVLNEDWMVSWMNINQSLWETLGLTYFEIATAMALEYFKENNCGALVLETGLGGRLDATTVIEPSMCVISAVGMDHQAILGNTVELIWREKLGILSPGVPVIIQEENPVRIQWAREAADKIGCPLYNATEKNYGVDNPLLTLKAEFGEYSIFGDGLKSSHKWNIIQAVLALEIWRNEKLPLVKLHIPVVCGRRQCVPGKGFPDLVLDVSHNEDGVSALVDWMERHQRDKRPIVLFSLMRDKDVVSVFNRLSRMKRAVIHYVQLPLERALPLSEFMTRIGENPGNIQGLELDKLTIEEWIHRWDPVEDLIVICGSFYLVGRLIPMVSAFYQDIAEVP